MALTRNVGAAEGQHLANGLPGFFGLSGTPRLRALVRAQRHHGRRGEGEGPQAPARLCVPVHVPGAQREPLRRGVFGETGQGHVTALPDVHLQTQHHGDLFHPAGRRGDDEPRRVRGVLLCQRSHYDPQVRRACTQVAGRVKPGVSF